MADPKAGPQHPREWLAAWSRASAVLEAERWARVVALTDDEASRSARALYELWRPDWPTDEGEGLLRVGEVLRRQMRSHS